MSEPTTVTTATAAVTTVGLAALFPQYGLIIGGALSGALYALWGNEQMTRAQGLKFVARAVLPALVFAGGASELASRYLGLDLREAFAPVSFLIAVFHRQGGALLLQLIKLRAKT